MLVGPARAATRAFRFYAEIGVPACQGWRLDRWHLYRRPPARIRSELHSAADACGGVVDLGGESVASPMNSTRTAVWVHLLFSCRRMRCITLMILREFVST